MFRNMVINNSRYLILVYNVDSHYRNIVTDFVRIDIPFFEMKINIKIYKIKLPNNNHKTNYTKNNLTHNSQKNYNKKWEELSRGTSVHPAQIVTDEIRNAFKKVLEDPNAASRWFMTFRRQPRVLQEHSSVDNLFDDVELVDVAFQQLVHCWLNVSFSGSDAAASCLWF